MIRKKCIGVEKIRPAERIEQILSLRRGKFDLLAAPAFHALDASAHVIPTVGHPLLVFFEGVRLHESLECRLDGIGRNAGENLRGSGSATVKFQLAQNTVGAASQAQQHNENGNQSNPWKESNLDINTFNFICLSVITKLTSLDIVRDVHPTVITIIDLDDENSIFSIENVIVAPKHSSFACFRRCEKQVVSRGGICSST